jgi:hypothetical protein
MSEPAKPVYRTSEKRDALEPDRKLRRSGRAYRKINDQVPQRVRDQVIGTMMAGIVRQHIAPGETLPQMVTRLCPQVYAMAHGFGYSLELDLAENTNANLASGKVFYVLRRLALH